MSNWRSPDHPRDPEGKFRYKGMSTGWHTYRDRKGVLHSYYINNASELRAGSQLLSMAAHGPVQDTGSNIDVYDPERRIQLVSSEEGEQMMVAASERGTFGVIDHDRVCAADTASYSRGSKYDKARKDALVDSRDTDSLRSDETGMGGSPIPAGDQYGTLDAQEAEHANAKAFEDQNHVYSIDPGDIANRVSDVKNAYRDKFGVTRAQSEDMDVHVWVDGRDGELRVAEAYSMGADGVLKHRRSPNTHGGSPSVRLKAGDVTRMTRSMQDEKLEHVDFAIKGGTTLTRTGKPKANALHFRSSFTERSTNDSITMWGTIEQHNGGVKVAKPEQHGIPRGQAAYQRRQAALKLAQRHYDPGDDVEARKLLQVRYPDRDIPSRLVHNTPGKGVRLTHNGYDYRFDTRGNFRGVDIRSAKGFADMVNREQKRSEGKRISESDVRPTSWGGYRVTRHVRPNHPERDVYDYYDSHGRMTDGMGHVYRNQPLEDSPTHVIPVIY
jgi:hypothetical protein